MTITVAIGWEGKEEMLELLSSTAHHMVNNSKTLQFRWWNSCSAVLSVQRSLVPTVRFSQKISKMRRTRILGGGRDHCSALFCNGRLHMHAAPKNEIRFSEQDNIPRCRGKKRGTIRTAQRWWVFVLTECKRLLSYLSCPLANAVGSTQSGTCSSRAAWHK